MKFSGVLLRCWAALLFVAVLVHSEESLDNNDLVEHVHPTLGVRWYSKRTANKLDDQKYKFCALFENSTDRLKRPTLAHANVQKNDLPVQFDAREKWSHCPSIKNIRDQAKCGSCWAFGAVEAMSDRLCIHKSTESSIYTEELSAEDLMSCCKVCGSGCNGGWPAKAWDYWKNEGIVNEQCKPYSWPPCSHVYPSTRYPPCSGPRHETPMCYDGCYETTLKPTKIKGHISYNLPPYDEVSIMQEIMTQGPVEISFDVYEDFRYYHKGIYFHAWGENVGGHAVRLLGWGEKEGVPYWLLANSWNEDWGEKGYVRFLRGMNECKIEEEATAGLPEM